LSPKQIFISVGRKGINSCSRNKSHTVLIQYIIDNGKIQFPYLHNCEGALFLTGKVARRSIDHPPPSSTEVTQKVELYFYSPTGPSCFVLG
jgi:hypothetical protein